MWLTYKDSSLIYYEIVVAELFSREGHFRPETRPSQILNTCWRLHARTNNTQPARRQATPLRILCSSHRVEILLPCGWEEVYLRVWSTDLESAKAKTLDQQAKYKIMTKVTRIIDIKEDTTEVE